ncbi:Wzz/FepE/Etk N-terminal domain-containing protein [Eubacteriaceae bacterium ES3]|nr:Wzz/FepE/Etk N-terminal domain-containing protein [Eubacteriaceae bacterium ES3]
MKETIVIDLKKITAVLIKKWWLILIFTTISFGTSYLVADRYLTPIYEATTVLFLGTENTSLADLDSSLMDTDRQLITDYQHIALSHSVIDPIISNLNLQMTYAEFLENIFITAVEGSRLFTISFQSPDPIIANSVANSLANQLLQSISATVGVENIQILDSAPVPDAPIFPRMLNVLILGTSLGILLALAIIIFAFLLDNTVKNEDDVENLIGTSVLGNIPKVK